MQSASLMTVTLWILKKKNVDVTKEEKSYKSGGFLSSKSKK